jgi:hypothetical protein
MCELMTGWYLLQCGKKERSQPTFKFIYLHKKNACLNGWHNAINHQWSQRRWGSTHRPHHIIVACYCNRCTKICLSKVNEVMHPDMVFHCVNDGLGNLVHRMKDWHERMLGHENIRKKRAHE